MGVIHEHERPGPAAEALQPPGQGFERGECSDRSAQRGSVADMPLYSGDPLTPGVGATKNAKRLDRKDV